jgi:hypothetical protein
MTRLAARRSAFARVVALSSVTNDYSVTHADLRKKWVSGGMLWWSNLVAPPDWDPVEQIKRAVTSHD